MKSTIQYIVTALVLAVILFAGFATADMANKWREIYTNSSGVDYYMLRYNRSFFSDTLVGATYDTVTVRMSQKKNVSGYSFGFVVDSAAFTLLADTVMIWSRPVFNDNWFGSAAGSAWIPILIRSADGDSTYVLDPEPGAQYWVEDFAPVYTSDFQQFLIYCGSEAEDSVIFSGEIQQIKVNHE